MRWMGCLSLWFSCTSQLLASSLPAPAIEKLHQSLSKAEAQAKFVGLSIVILNQAGDEWQGHFGLRDLERGLTPNQDTIYELGSITKSFARLALATQTKIKPEDNLDQYLPVGIRAPKPSGQAISIAHLMTHTGLKLSLPCTIRATEPERLKCFGFNPGHDMHDPYVLTSREQNYAFINELSYSMDEFPDYFPKPGAFRAYSNVGLGLLGEILAEQYSTSFETYLIEQVLKPLKLNSTYITMPCEQDQSCDNLAKVYVKQQMADQWQLASLWHMPGMQAAGALRSSLYDMKLFLQANLRPEHSTLASAIELSQSALPQITQTHNQNICQPGQIPAAHLCNPQKKYFYYAWEATGLDGLLYHAGATGASQSMMMFSADRSLGVVILSNSRVGKGEQNLYHYPNDLALCVFQLMGQTPLAGFDFCQKI